MAKNLFKFDTNSAEWKSLDSRLKQLAPKVQRAIARTVLRKMSQPLVRAIKANILNKGQQRRKAGGEDFGSFPSSRTGNLRRSISSVIRTYRGGASIVAVVGPRASGKNDGWYGRIVEAGHRNRAPKRSILGIVKVKDRITGQTPPYPFLKPAYDRMLSQMETIRNTELKRAIEGAALGN